MKIGVVQLTSLMDPAHNLARLDELISKAANEGAKAVFLPECFYSMSDGTRPTPFQIEEGQESYTSISNLAKKHQVFLLGGSAATKVDGTDLPLNRCYNFNPSGGLIGFYDKINLFSCDLTRSQSVPESDRKILKESNLFTAGSNPKIIEVNEWKIGLAICFDLRFPELFSNYRAQGANLLTCSSAFTRATGKAHWHTLLRSRAIENQCYVVAADQWGKHSEKLTTYGHSLVIDPWGDILLDLKEGEGYGVASISLERVEKTRAKILMR